MEFIFEHLGYHTRNFDSIYVKIKEFWGNKNYDFEEVITIAFLDLEFKLNFSKKHSEVKGIVIKGITKVMARMTKGNIIELVQI